MDSHDTFLVDQTLFHAVRWFGRYPVPRPKDGQRYADQGLPVISVDTKKRELIGNFKNNGRTWTAQPEVVNVHDFESDAVGPMLTRNLG